MTLSTERPETPDEPSPGVPPPNEEDEDTGADADMPEIAPLGPPMVPERGDQGNDDYGISAYTCTIGI